MELSKKVVDEIVKLPPALRQVVDAELAAGNWVNCVEFGRGDQAGKVALILDRPFRTDVANPPAGVLYREFTDRDPRIFEYYTADETYSLVTAKFKPMVFEKITGPPNPTEAHIAFMQKRAAEEEAVAVARKQAANQPPPPPHEERLADAGNRFLASMTMTFDMWHDGTGYDLDALRQVSESERSTIETILIQHQPRDWRDIEALAVIDSPQARAEIEKALKHSDINVRREAMKYLPEKIDPQDREAKLIHALQNDSLYSGLSQAIDEVDEFHPPAVIDALFRGALNRDGQSAVHFAAMLFFLHGKANEPFDWAHRPFFLRFNTADRKERRQVFAELCETVGVDAKTYMR